MNLKEKILLAPSFLLAILLYMFGYTFWCLGHLLKALGHMIMLNKHTAKGMLSNWHPEVSIFD
ncbi:MAG: hypothetical protein FD170_3978 [Bacteroidetes bacterium]|nr:MAG: hypothetical protein FD170_3978 [Bacteroidota bacterium]